MNQNLNKLETQNHHLEYCKIDSPIAKCVQRVHNFSDKNKTHQNRRFTAENNKRGRYSEWQRFTVNLPNFLVRVSGPFLHSTFSRIRAINFYYLGYLNTDKREEAGSRNMLKKAKIV